MHTENLTDALARCLELLDEPAAEDPRAEFEARFAAELHRLEKAGPSVRAADADSLLSALGAAQVGEWELALAFLDSARRSHSSARRPLSLGTLRQRFHFVMAMGADTPRQR
jgi:hypothetical protein